MERSSSDVSVKERGEEPTNPTRHRNKRTREDSSERNFKNFKEEIKSMIENMFKAQEKQLKTISPTLLEIKQMNSNIESSIAFLSTQNDELKKKIEQLEISNKKDREYITHLEEKLEDVERANRKTHIEIKNVPKLAKESTEDLLKLAVRLSEAIDCKITKSDISDIYRIRGKHAEVKASPIVIELSSAILKAEFLKKCKEYNLRNKIHKLSAKDLGMSTGGETPIYVSEQLTAKGARLRFLARDLANSKGYRFCWTSLGRVYVRKTETSEVIMIKSEAQVQRLMQVT